MIQINTVKNIAGGGYLLNGKTTVPNNNDNSHYQAIQEWIAAGNLPDPEYTDIELLARARSDKMMEIETAYNSAISANIDYMSTSFQADPRSVLLISQVLSVGSVSVGFFWLDSSNNQVAMDYSQLQGLAVVILGRGQIEFEKKTGLKAQIVTAIDIANINAIVW